MTENEAIKGLETSIDLAKMCTQNYERKREIQGYEMAINALKEIQKYRKIEKDLKENYHANVDIPLLMKHFIETVFKGEKHEGFCILTNEDKEAWEEYKAIGTPEECRAAMERQNPRAAITEKEDTGTTKYTCPACGRYMGWSTGTFPARYCWKCGQKLDWEDKE
nr:MAG TPA: ribosome, girodazole, girolline, antibiotic complex, 50S [Caudoviricetes sp.]